MDMPLKSEIQFENLSPEVKSFIYQIILEFEPFTTPETVVSVIAKNPLELLSRIDDDPDDTSTDGAIDHGELPKRHKLKKMYRIAITISEDGGTLEAEGLHEDIYEAIKIAKDRLLKTLREIQDDVVSSQDRHMQIRHALAAGGSVH